jgi:hypothetical protein
MRFDELEFTDLATVEQPQDLLHVIGDVIIKQRQDVRVAGGGERGNFRQHVTTKPVRRGWFAAFKRRQGVRNDVDLGKQRQNLL